MAWKLSALDRKLVRDLRAMSGQAIAIAAVIAAGIALYVAMLSTFDALELTLRTYYDRYRFADVFVSLKRAPASLAGDLSAIPGVAQLETRVVADVMLDLPDLAEPATGRLVSMPVPGRPLLCDVFLREGRFVEPGHPDETLVSEDFAVAHGLRPGSTVTAVINGRRRDLRIVGIALSPEYIYPIRPGELMPDTRRFGVFWMERRALASAFNLDGAFNNVVLRLTRGASEPDVVRRVDRMLEAGFGGLGAVVRANHPSHWYLNNELVQLRDFGGVIPVIFLAVAAFLLNVVLSRIVTVQRPQTAALKALGYRHRDIAAHYVKLSLAIASAGALAGVGVGAWFGWALTQMYARFFHFPILVYRLQWRVVVAAVAIGLIAAGLGALSAVRRAAKLPPAEAMRPEPPARFRPTWLERAGAGRLFTQPTRIILRSMQRHPGRVALSVLGIALGTGLMVVGTFGYDAIQELTDVQFNVVQRFDAVLTFVEPASGSALDEVRRLPGVVDAEPFRAVAVRLRVGHRTRRTAITGIDESPRLYRVVDASMRLVDPPPSGLVLSDKLARLLGAGPGDAITVETLEGNRAVHQIPVAGVVEEYMGLNAYMDLAALHRLMGESDTLSGAYLQVDPAGSSALYARLKTTPRVAGVLLKTAAYASFTDTMASMMYQMLAVYVLFAGIIAFGVVYNNARIALSERSRELATLRVIGFTLAEISYVLLGELAIATLVAIPVGLALGYAMAASIMSTLDTEMFRLPLVVRSGTYVLAAGVTTAATAFSALVVRRRLVSLDLVAVLKARE